jgi:peptide/nickel transport system substrate-binding protein
MRQLLSCVVTVVCATGAVACTPSSASTARPIPAGEFRILIPDRPSSLNPNVQLNEIALLVGRSIFSQLLSLNESGRLVSELAETWSVSADGRVYTFQLRNNVRWHDGAPFSSADVKWTLEALGTHGFAGRDVLAPVESIAAPDPTTIVIALRYPWAPFATDLAGPGVSILPRHIYEGGDWGTHPANERPVGTGPFKFGRWADADTLVLDANTDYFRSGPYVQRIVFDTVPADAVSGRLLRGEADYSVVRPPSIDFESPPPPLVARTLATSGRYYLALNLRRAPFHDVRVRKALAMTIDRLQLVSEALRGVGAPAVGWYSPDVEWAYNDDARVPVFDRQQAEQLLDAAGVRRRSGVRFAATMVVPPSPHMMAMAESVRTQLAGVGIAVTIESMALGEWAQRTLSLHDFDLAVVAGAQGPDPDQLRRRFLASTDTGAYIGYDEPEFRDAVERGARMVSVAERADAYYRAQEILARDVPFVPLAEAVKVVVHNQRISGMPQLEARGLVGSFDFSLVKIGARPTTRR